VKKEKAKTEIHEGFQFLFMKDKIGRLLPLEDFPKKSFPKK
jgi:hypothetical protein